MGQAAIMAVMLARGAIVDQFQFATRVAPLIRAIVEGEMFIPDDQEAAQMTQEMRDDFKERVGLAFEKEGWPVPFTWKKHNTQKI